MKLVINNACSVCVHVCVHVCVNMEGEEEEVGSGEVWLMGEGRPLLVAEDEVE